jgi:putative membrane protein
MKRLFYISLTLVALLTVQACNNRKAKNYNKINQTNGEGITFVSSALESNTAEVKLSQLAVSNSKNAEVQSFAKTMITYHTEAGAELKKISGSKATTDSLSQAHVKLLTGLAAKKGSDFDKEYIQAMVIDHETAVNIFKAGQNNTDKKLKAFADKTLPKIQDHLKEANSLCTGLK